jgi:hypothetical protein
MVLLGGNFGIISGQSSTTTTRPVGFNAFMESMLTVTGGNVSPDITVLAVLCFIVWLSIQVII